MTSHNGLPVKILPIGGQGSGRVDGSDPGRNHCGLPRQHVRRARDRRPVSTGPDAVTTGPDAVSTGPDAVTTGPDAITTPPVTGRHLL
jgi:hypothetical protein